ncbi:MAG: PKD-like domain-containing protein, partial [Bacteroidota bacterium]
MKKRYSSICNKNKKKIVSARVVFFIATLVMSAFFNNSFGAVTITAPSLSITTCAFPSSSSTLSNIVIAEAATNNISTFGTLILTAPANFEFTSAGTASYSGTNVTSANIVLTNSTTLTLTIGGSGTDALDTIRLSSIQIRAITAAAGPGTVTRTGGTSVINGDANGAVHATLTSFLNSVTGGTISSAQTICSGGNPALLSYSSAATGSGALTYQWQAGTDGSTFPVNEVTTNTFDPPAGLTATTYYRSITTSTLNSVVCTAISNELVVTVNPLPAVTNSASANTCSAAGPNIVLTANIASSFAWTIGAITGGITGATASSGGTINQTLTNPSSSVVGTVQYIVTPTSTVGSCAGSAFTITVTVNPIPALTNAGTASICSGTSPNISLTSSVASSYSWTIGTIVGSVTGSLAGSGGTINQTLTNPSNASAGSVEYMITPTSSTGSCVGTPDTITVTVNPTPAVTNASTKSICSGASTSIALTSSAASSFSWTLGTITGSVTGAVAGSGAAINQNLTNPSNSGAGSVQYLITPTSTVGTCAGSAHTITVTVNPVPLVTTSATASTCSGTGPNIALTASAASSFSWTVGAITGSITGASASSGATINQTLSNPSNSVAGTVQYLVTPTSTTGSCAGAAFTITVTVNPAPAVTNGVTASACSGNGPNITLTSDIASSFSWTIGTITGSITGASASSGSTINQTLTNPSNASAGTVEYIVTPTSTTGTCAGAATTITVTVNPIPVVTTASTKTICSGAGSNVSLTASAASNFTWTIGTITGGVTGATASSGSTINQTLTNPGSTLAGSVEYLVTPTSTGGICVGSAYTITVTVNPAPVVTNASTKTICSGAGTSISLTSSVASSFTWTIGAITGSITGASASSGGTINQTLTNPSSSVVGTVQYIVTPTSTVGSCAGAAFTITVTVNPTPALTNSAVATICSGTGPNISLTSSVASSYSWTIGTIVGSVTGSLAGSGATINQTLTNPSNASAGSVEYVVTPTSSTGSCVGSATTITVTVNPTPAVTNASTKSICSGA